MLMPHSINHGNACFAYFNKIWGIPPGVGLRGRPLYLAGLDVDASPYTINRWPSDLAGPACGC